MPEVPTYISPRLVCSLSRFFLESSTYRQAHTHTHPTPTGRIFILLVLSQMAATNSAEPGRSQESGTTSWSLVWLITALESAWAIVWCFSSWFRRELYWKWISQDSNCCPYRMLSPSHGLLQNHGLLQVTQILLLLTKSSLSIFSLKNVPLMSCGYQLWFRFIVENKANSY